MPKHAEVRFLPYTAEQLFDLVIAIDRYPEFLPWCVEARIHRREPGYIQATLAIGYKMIREKFTSHVHFEHSHSIRVTYDRGPFKHLTNTWVFRPVEKDGKMGCEVDFFVDFEFRSKLLEAAIGVIFTKAIFHMVASFESRARALYG